MQALNSKGCRSFTEEEILEILQIPLLELITHARHVHQKNFPEGDVQLASLLSIKTGSCPEDCKYCPQSAHYRKTTKLKSEPLMNVQAVIDKARQAKEKGATRFCMGAAWRRIPKGDTFQKVLQMIRGVKELGLEPCVTFGSITQEEAKKLAEAGLHSYNHNIDSSPEFYAKIITTRPFQERLETIQNISKAGIAVCSGVIVGMGEKLRDRAKALSILANLDPQPASVPINALVPVPGTPFENRPIIDPLEVVRMIAATRIAIPKARVRLSAGRKNFSKEAHILCFMAGANSIFYGEKLLTTQNNDSVDDIALINDIGGNAKNEFKLTQNLWA